LALYICRMLKISGKEVYEFEQGDSGADLVQIGSDRYHLIHNSRAFLIEVVKKNEQTKEFVLKVNNRIYKLKAQNDIDLLLEKLGMEKSSEAAVSDLKAPMPGLVLSLEVEEGQEVPKGGNLMILEAMKMENIIKAPADVVVKQIKCTKGEAVEKGQILMVFGN
jgi:acetyl/propionyl-CoA carboxylase alpha subunit